MGLLKVHSYIVHRIKYIIMIIDSLQNATTKYYSVHPLFAKAFEYIGVNLAGIEPGTYLEILAMRSKPLFLTKKVNQGKNRCRNLNAIESILISRFVLTV